MDGESEKDVYKQNKEAFDNAVKWTLEHASQPEPEDNDLSTVEKLWLTAFAVLAFVAGAVLVWVVIRYLA